MQGKGIIVTFAVILGLICVYELIPTFYVQSVERKAERLAQGDKDSMKVILEELAKDTLPIIVTDLDYYSAQEEQMNLGLDLKGGINVMLQISVKDLLVNYADNSTHPVFTEAIEATEEVQKNSDNTYLNDFFNQFEKIKNQKDPNLKLSSFEIFGNKNNAEDIKANISTDAEVKSILQEKIDVDIKNAFQVFRTRIDNLGVTQPNIQRVGNSGRILIELPGVTEPDRIRKMLETSARLEFWKVSTSTFRDFIAKVDALDSTQSQSFSRTLHLGELDRFNQSKGKQGIGDFSAIGVVNKKDVNAVQQTLYNPKIKQLLAPGLKYTKFVFGNKPIKEHPDYVALYALEGNSKNEPALDGGITKAGYNLDPAKGYVVNMTMDAESTRDWALLTGANVGRVIAVVLDNKLYSAANIVDKITGGRTEISGTFTKEEAEDLSEVLKSGKLPTTAKIIRDEVVGPSLGEQSIKAGLYSFLIALGIILIWMLIYYGGAGLYADIALVINLFFIIGILASIKAVLTLPGIAGLVLTLGMAVDANIIIFERIKEELHKGKGLKMAVKDGFNHALSAILDGNITTFITALILFLFGDGPIKGFATTLMIGIGCTLFTALLLSRVFIENRISKDKPISFWTSISKNWFSNVTFDWMGKRKIAYIVSIAIMLVGIASLSIRQLNYGVDFVGGRYYKVNLAQEPQDMESLSKLLGSDFIENGQPSKVEVKQIGDANEIKVTTKYKIDDESLEVDTEIKQKLFKDLKQYLPSGFTYDDFSGQSEDKEYGILASSKVGPTIADDIKFNGMYATFGALLLIFLYILIRFSKWQLSLGAVAALFHDAVVVLAAFSLLYGHLSFSLEIDQAFIAAILTVIGYSINDTVIVFDRFRENLGLHGKMPLKDVFNLSINQIIGRTVNTSATTLFVILAIFIFGGESLRGFMFALLIGIGVGTYSSTYVASALAYDLLKKDVKNRKAE